MNLDTCYAFRDELNAIWKTSGAMSNIVREAYATNPGRTIGGIAGLTTGALAGGYAGARPYDEEGHRSPTRALLGAIAGGAVGNIAGKHLGGLVTRSDPSFIGHQNPVPSSHTPLSVQPDPFPPSSMEKFLARGRRVRDQAMGG